MALSGGRLSLAAPHLPHLAQTIPALVYGTAWKKDATADLVYQALKAGFTGIDTANQPKHYQEHLVGSGVRRALQEGLVQRSNIYLQTKFTSVDGQDLDSLPYRISDPIAQQVRDSVQSSLHNLRSEGEDFEDIKGSYIDTLVLHSPMTSHVETMEVWKVLEGLVPSRIRNLGLSNCDLSTLRDVYEQSTIKPAVVQNRFHPATRFDGDLRSFCRDKGIVYQSFWTLTANPSLVWSAEVGRLADRLRISPQGALYCLVLGLGNTVILNGTKQIERMKADMKAVEIIGKFISERPDEWEKILLAFKKLVGDPMV